MRTALLAAAFVLLVRAPAHAAPEAVASIAPVHALVAGVMEGVGEPALLVPAGTSPHGHALRPSDARRLAAARAVFWVGPELEGWLTDAIPALAPDAAGVALLDAADGPGAGSAFRDPHVWLAPDRAAVMAGVIGDALADIDPANAARYRANAASLRARILENADAMRERLAPFRDRSYVVLHDAYRPFTASMGLAPPAASLDAHAGHSHGAGRLRAVREAARAGSVRCIFVEPQFSRRTAESLAADTGLAVVPIDPLGAGIPPGPGLYFGLLESVAESFAACLAG